VLWPIIATFMDPPGFTVQQHNRVLSLHFAPIKTHR